MPAREPDATTVPTQKRSAVEKAGKSSGGGGVGGAGGKARQEIKAATPTGGSSPRFSLCPACPERPLCNGDGLRAPDTVLGHAEQKEALGREAENEFLSNTP
jgi:hypothetical protein